MQCASSAARPHHLAVKLYMGDSAKKSNRLKMVYGLLMPQYRTGTISISHLGYTQVFYSVVELSTDVTDPFQQETNSHENYASCRWKELAEGLFVQNKILQFNFLRF